MRPRPRPNARGRSPGGPQYELDAARRIALRGDQTEGGGGRDVGAGRAEYHLVEGVQELAAELDADAFGDGKVARDREVEVAVVIAAQVAISAGGGAEAVFAGVNEGRGGEPRQARFGVVAGCGDIERRVGSGDAVGTADGESTADAGGGGDPDGRSALPDPGAAHLPAFGERAGGGGFRRASERHLPDAARDQAPRHIEARNRAILRDVVNVLDAGALAGVVSGAGDVDGFRPDVARRGGNSTAESLLQIDLKAVVAERADVRAIIADAGVLREGREQLRARDGGGAQRRVGVGDHPGEGVRALRAEEARGAGSAIGGEVRAREIEILGRQLVEVQAGGGQVYAVAADVGDVYRHVLNELALHHEVPLLVVGRGPVLRNRGDAQIGRAHV